MTMTEPEKCFCSLKRVKTFLKSTVSQDHLPALAMLSVERVMIENINFSDKVTDKFANHKKGEWASYIVKIVNEVISY